MMRLFKPHHYYMQKARSRFGRGLFSYPGSANELREPNNIQLHLRQSQREQPMTKALA
jgi:hypothetical protein